MTDMKKEMATQPKIASWMVEMQMEHNLPIEITIGEKCEELQAITFNYEEEDENVVHWVVDKCVNRFVSLYG